MMKKLISSLVVVLVAVALASCSGDSNNKMQFALSDCVTATTNLSASSTFESTGASYLLDLNYDTSSADLTISNLIIEAGAQPKVLNLRDLRFRTNSQGALEISLSSTTASSGSHVYDISNFKLLQVTAYIHGLGRYANLYSISFVIDGNYQVNVVQNSLVTGGSTTVTDLSDGDSSMTDTTTGFGFKLDIEKKLAKIYAYNLRIDSHVISTMEISAIPFVINQGSVVMQLGGPADALVDGTTKSEVITSLSAGMYPSLSQTIAFIYDARWQVSATLGLSNSFID